MWWWWEIRNGVVVRLRVLGWCMANRLIMVEGHLPNKWFMLTFEFLFFCVEFDLFCRGGVSQIPTETPENYDKTTSRWKNKGTCSPERQCEASENDTSSVCMHPIFFCYDIEKLLQVPSTHTNIMGNRDNNTDLDGARNRLFLSECQAFTLLITSSLQILRR